MARAFLQRRIELAAYCTCQIASRLASTTRPYEGTEAPHMTEIDRSPFAEHFEFLGYQVAGPANDGWYRAEHTRRWNFFFRPTGVGVRLHCTIHLGDRVLLKHREWLEFVNRFNGQALFVRAALEQDADGDYVLRLRALMAPQYERVLVGALMDMWHTDMDGVRDGPSLEDDADVPASASVN